MAATVDIQKYVEIIDCLVSIKKDLRVVPFVWGNHGVGKTMLNCQLAENHWYNYVVLNLANQTPEDLLGYPDGRGGFIMPTWFNKEFKIGRRIEFTGEGYYSGFGEIIDITHQTLQEKLNKFMETDKSSDKYGDAVVNIVNAKDVIKSVKIKLKDEDEEVDINFSDDGTTNEILLRPTLYFLDEINRAPKYVLQSMFNFINEGRIHEHMMGDLDFVVAAANPCDIDYEVTDFTDKAFLSRFAHFYLEPTQMEFLRYLENQDASPIVMKTLRANPDFDGYTNEVSIDSQIHTEPDNRALDKISQFMCIVEKNVVESIGELLFTAMIGQDYAMLIMAQWNEAKKLPSPEEILNMTSKMKYPFKKTDLDMISVMNANISKYICERMFDKEGRCEPNKKQLVAFKRYLIYIPKDAEMQLVTDMKTRIDPGGIVEIFEAMDENYLDELLETQIAP